MAGVQVLFGMETVECEVALTSAAIPASMVLDLGSSPVATLRVNAQTGIAEVRSYSPISPILHACHLIVHLS